MKTIAERFVARSGLPPVKEVRPRNNSKPYDRRDYSKGIPQNQLNALRRWAVPAGKVLNPYGKLGYCHRARYRLGKRVSLREEAMERKRLRLKQQKIVALEQHELQQMARENATLAMETLIEISQNKRAPEATRIAASAVILDRGYGKASQTSITANVTNGKNNDLTPEELDKRVKKALKRVEELTDRAPEKGKSTQRPARLRQLH